MTKFIFLTFFLLSNFSNLNASDIRINSIITLENNIPKECGLNFKILEKNKTSDTKVSIKKNKDKKTTTCGINPSSGRCKIGMPNDKQCKLGLAKNGRKNCSKIV